MEAEANAEPDPESTENEAVDDGVMFAARPSLLGLIPAAIKAMILLAIIWLVIKYPLESIVNDFTGERLTIKQEMVIGRYREIIGWALGAVIVFGILYKAFYLKMIHYEVSADRIEWSRGVLDRRVDNLDMFRVVDLKLRRNLIDCIVGIGTVALITTDKSDPEFVFKKVRNCRELYDVIKKASLEADRKTGVVHLE
jgi:hypothetical protein